MSQQCEGPNKSFEADGSVAMPQYSRVKVTAGVLALAGLNERGIGIIQEPVYNNSTTQHVAVRLWNAPGTFKMIAAGAVVLDANVFAAASGKMDDAQGTVRLGKALETASGNNSIIEVLPIIDEPISLITHHVASATLTRAQRNGVHTNLAAAGAVTLTLPQDAVAGDRFFFNVMTAQELRIDSGAAGGIYINGAKQADDAYISADDEGEHVTLTADGNGDWVAGPTNGTWTVV